MPQSPIAWQTFVVITLTVASGAITAMLGNADVLDLDDQKWLTIIILPAVSSLLTLASNQLKSIGQTAPNTITETRVTTVTPPPEPAEPPTP